MKKRNHAWSADDPETTETPEAGTALDESGTAAASQDQGGMIGSNARAAGPPVVTPFALPAAGTAAVVYRYGYPKSPGDERWSALDVVGPASYTVVVPGTPVTGGQAIPASAFGLMSIDCVFSVAGSTGTWGVEVIPAPYTFGDSMPGVILLWYVLATGAQVAAAVNLSGSAVRLIAVGR